MTMIIKALFISLTIIPYFGLCQTTNPIKYKTSIEVITDDSVFLDKMNKKQNEDNPDSIVFDPYGDYEFCITFPGGEKAFIDFIQKNLNYPENAKKNHIEGKVIASFVINEKGEIDNIKIEKGLCEDIDNEVIRIISKMPNWTWDCKVQVNRHIRIKRRIPISFRLEEDKK